MCRKLNITKLQTYTNTLAHIHRYIPLLSICILFATENFVVYFMLNYFPDVLLHIWSLLLYLHTVRCVVLCFVVICNHCTIVVGRCSLAHTHTRSLPRCQTELQIIRWYFDNDCILHATHLLPFFQTFFSQIQRWIPLYLWFFLLLYVFRCFALGYRRCKWPHKCNALLHRILQVCTPYAHT